MRINKTWLSIIFLLLAGITGHAQSIDNLTKELAKATSAEARSQLSYKLGVKYFDNDQFDTSIAYFKRSAQVAKQAGYDTMYLEACGFMSAVLREAGRNEESLLYCDTAIAYARQMHLPLRAEDFLVEKASTFLAIGKFNEFAAPIREALNIALAANNKSEEARIYWVTAIYYDDLYNYALELDHVNRAIVIYDSLKDFRRTADGYRFISINFTKRKKWLESLHYAKRADSMYAKLGMTSARNALKLDAATDHNNLGQYELAMSMYRQCLDSFKNDEYLQLRTYAAMGKAQYEHGSFAEARNSFAHALLLNEKIKEPALDVSIYSDLSRAFLTIHQLDSALYFAKKGESVFKTNAIELPALMEHIAQLRDVYEARNELAAANAYNKQYIALQDSMYRGILQNNLADAETRFHLTEKNKELSELSTENELQKVTAQKQTLLNISLTIGLCLGGVIVVLIVTAYRRTLKQNELLARQKQELQQQKDIIDAQVVQLGSTAKMKSKFLANISHELRTPVTLLNGMLEIMNSKKHTGEPKEKERLDIAYNNSRKLQNMVEEILDLARLENNRSQPVYETKEIGPLMERIVRSFETLLEREQLALEYDDTRAAGTYVYVDTTKFEKIVNNLVYNAVKFNRKGGHIKVSLYPAADNERIQIDVIDSGIGISEVDMPYIFEHFYQGETQGLKADGAGIGLSLVKEFTLLMGGTIAVKSKPGEGTTFSLQFENVARPADADEQPVEIPAYQPEAWERFATRQKLLIVEDNAEMRYYLQDILGEHVDIATADNGIEGLAWMEQNLPDLVISDVMMPGMDGREFINQLKADERYKKIPVITLTALADKESELSFLRLGVDDYIIKPFNATELRIRVYNLLANLAERRAFSQEPAEADDISTDGKEAEEFRSKITAYVLAHIKNADLSVEDLARELLLSRRQLYRFCKSLTGQPPAQLIKEIRLQKAYDLLLHGDIYKIDDVCTRVGYEKTSYFSQQFFERFGKRPTELL